MRSKTFLIALSVLVLSLSSCDKNKIGGKPVTGDVLNVGFESVELTGSASVSRSGAYDITIGVHYSKSEGMLLTNSEEVEVESFDKNYAFSIKIEGLDPQTKYYYRTYVKENDVYAFGKTKSFTTTAVPEIKLSSESASLNYMEQEGSFTVDVENPSGIYYLDASTTDTWITDIQFNALTVSYKVSENKTEVSRTGKIRVTYGPLAKDFSIKQERIPIINGHEYVDLGLSVKWATCNVGASKPEDYGGYYQWAGTKDVISTSINLDWSNCPYHTGSDENTGWTKYVWASQPSYWSGTGSADGKTLLDPSDDVARVVWKGSWRMPTHSEFDELVKNENCSWTWTSINGINGYKVQSKKPGYTDNWIFLPAAGRRRSGKLEDVQSTGRYWAATILGSSTLNGDILYLSETSHNSAVSNLRYYGNSVRPVTE